MIQKQNDGLSLINPHTLPHPTKSFPHKLGVGLFDFFQNVQLHGLFLTIKQEIILFRIVNRNESVIEL